MESDFDSLVWLLGGWDLDCWTLSPLSVCVPVALSPVRPSGLL